MYVCTHSIRLARQGVTREAFSGLCNCWHTTPITLSNTRLCCCAAPSSHGHHQSGDFFPVTVANNSPYRGALFLLPFTCLNLLELFVYVLFLFFSFHVVVLCLLSTFALCIIDSLRREMTLPPDILPRLIWGL